jgi:NADP-dependent 3-hydroxy acid dehydrogenase YdfG
MKVIVITGASGGIGAALAKQLAARGDKVVLAARRVAELKQVASQCGADALAVVTDVTRRSDVEHLRDEALRAFGHVNVWVNNAGRGIGRPVLDLTDEDFDQMVETLQRSVST